MMTKYPRMKPERLTGEETFILNGLCTGDRVIDFWQWVSSDLMSNATRGILAEFIVSRALGLTPETRAEWDAFDLQTTSGAKVEVKSSAYVQSWFQESPSKINFGIAKTRTWSPETNKLDTAACRQADVYVFCLLAHTDQTTINPLDMNQWEFYVLPTSVLNKQKGDAKIISLSALKKLNPVECQYAGIREAVGEFE